MTKSKIVGQLWNDKSIDIVQIEEKLYALYGWNGEEWGDCWEVEDSQGLTVIVSSDKIRIRPIYQEVDTDEFELIGYRLV